MDQDSDEFGPMIGADNCVNNCLKENNDPSAVSVENLLKLKKQAEEEFGRQRAKFMELFQMKEEQLKASQEELATTKQLLAYSRTEVQKLSSSLDDARTAIVIAEMRKTDEVTQARKELEEELNSLRLIVSSQPDQDSVEEYRKSLAFYARRNEKLEAEIGELKAKLSESDEGFLSTLSKTIHKRVGAASATLTSEEENLEESMKKAQQDTAMLRAVITPMENEIDSLKSQLNRYEQQYGPLQPSVISHSVSANQLLDVTDNSASSSAHTSAASSMPASPVCRKCLKLEVQLDTARESEKRLQDQLITVQRLLEAERESVTAQAQYTAELETSLQSATVEAELQISALKTRAEESQRFLMAMKQRFTDTRTTVKNDLATMTCAREEIQAELLRLQEENETLSGSHLKHSQLLQDERINLPNNLEEMQELLLRYQDELITTKVAHERCQETMGSDLEIVRLQLSEQRGVAEGLSHRVQELEHELATQNSINSELERQKADAGASAVVNGSDNTQSTTSQKKQITQLKADKIVLEQTIQELNAQIIQFRSELSNNEAVQKDLISLSRSLQVQLERVRESEPGVVRWQHPDDVTVCDECNACFNNTSSSSTGAQANVKDNCRHCGHVFCEKCLTKSVQSGPSSRTTPVCNMCYTLLVKDSAPYMGIERSTNGHQNTAS